MGRDRSRKGDLSREPGRFIAIPTSVLESAAYLALSANARSLLLELALQCVGDNNGRLLLSRAFLAKRGWNSSDMISKGKRELLDGNLIFETVMGCRPNKASWYALTWRNLDRLDGFDPGIRALFERGAYRRQRPPTLLVVNAGLRPHGGPQQKAIGPRGGPIKSASAPPSGTVEPDKSPRAVPQDGHPLEMPSPKSGSRKFKGSR